MSDEENVQVRPIFTYNGEKSRASQPESHIDKIKRLFWNTNLISEKMLVQHVITDTTKTSKYSTRSSVLYLCITHHSWYMNKSKYSVSISQIQCLHLLDRTSLHMCYREHLQGPNQDYWIVCSSWYTSCALVNVTVTPFVLSDIDTTNYQTVPTFSGKYATYITLWAFA